MKRASASAAARRMQAGKMKGTVLQVIKRKGET
jgi:hypothetical protein